MDSGSAATDTQPGAGVSDAPTYMQRLLRSRAFHCPDATEAMAEACGAAQPLHALQVRHKG